MDENLAWLTQKTKESKCNKENFTFFPTHAVNAIELWSNKKVATPHLYINPPFQGYPPFLANVLVPPPPPPLKWLNFLKVLPPSINKGKGGRGGSLRIVLLTVKSNKNVKRALEIKFSFFREKQILVVC